MGGSLAYAADAKRQVSNLGERTVFRLWEYLGGPLRSDRDWHAADPMNDTGGHRRPAERARREALGARQHGGAARPGRQGWRELRCLHETRETRLSGVSLAKR